MLRIFSFPLFSKELIEQSARKRTYVIRCVYAILLIILFSIMYGTTSRSFTSQTLGIIGLGGELFNQLFYALYWSILLIMPALSAGAFSSEKEQGSLTILLLTDLKPWELIIQKWFSRIFIISSFLLISMPLMGLCYAFGGLELEHLVLGVYILFLLVLQTSSVSIAVSAWSRNTISALIGSYVILALIFLLPVLLSYMVNGSFRSSRNGFEALLWPEKMFPSMNRPGLIYSFIGYIFSSIPILLVIGSALIFARWALLKRAHIIGPGPILRLFRNIDTFFEKWDARIGRKKKHLNLPQKDPVAWRELNSRSLANWHYLFRFLTPALLIYSLLIVFLCAQGDRALYSFMKFSSLSFLGIILLLSLILGSTLIAAERTQQTLDVLLTTPLSARNILLEKLRGLRRINWIILIPALLIMLWVIDMQNNDANITYDSSSNLLATFSYFLLLPPLFTWFGIAIGLVVRSRNRAMITALICGIFWLGSPMIIGGVLFGLFQLPENSPVILLCYITPSMLVIINEGGGNAQQLFGGEELFIGIFICWHIFLWLAIRWWCIHNADRLMRRGSGS